MRPAPGPTSRLAFAPAFTALLLLLPAPDVSARPAGKPQLPDSVLAEVMARPPAPPPPRTVTRMDFVRGWNRLTPPARPDSLTPSGARRFLDLLVDKEVLALAASRERWTWTPQESTAMEHLRDRLMVEAALDSVLQVTRRGLGPGGDSLDRAELGLVARDSAMARLAPRFDGALATRLAAAWAALRRPSADSSLVAQLRLLGAMPVVDPGDTARVLASTPAGDYRVSELLASWRRLNPIYRPRITTPAGIEDLARNGLFERQLRREAADRQLDRRPDIAAALARQREYDAVSHLVAREVYARISLDSLSLLRCYERSRDEWALPLRARLLRMVLGSRAEADAMALRLASTAEAESLETTARRGGTDWVTEVSATSDSALFAAALRAGTGALLGPDRAEGGWRVARVLAVLPGRTRPFQEVRDLVGHRWYAEEGERLMQDLIARERARVRVRLNPGALDGLVAHPPPGIQAGPGPAGTPRR